MELNSLINDEVRQDVLLFKLSGMEADGKFVDQMDPHSDGPSWTLDLLIHMCEIIVIQP